MVSSRSTQNLPKNLKNAKTYKHDHSLDSWKSNLSEIFTKCSQLLNPYFEVDFDIMASIHKV
jgi:hypothetical protein